MYKTVLFFVFSLIISEEYFSQSNLGIQLQSEIPAICTELTVTMKHDTQSRPYLYVANKEAGLKIYDISTVTSPNLVATVSNSQYLNMEAINLTQSGNYLYLAVGNIWAADSTGMVIVNVQNPLQPIVTDFYVLPNSTHGAGIVQVEGDYAYLGAMQDGLITLNVSDKSNIQFVSQFIPDVNFPINNPNNLNIYNLRGMEVRNDTIYACYDGGGVRIIDVTNKLLPVQIGQYCNPVMYTPMDHPKAYNNIVLKDSLAYLAVDYCGVEVLNISNPADIQLIGWWNPYGCPNNNWFTSPVHANEIRLDTNCNALFVSTGKSDLYVLDVSNPTSLDSIGFYGGVNNGIGTWGVNIYENQIYLSYICVPWPYIPFASNWTGVKILTYNACPAQNDEISNDYFFISPNPTKDILNVKLNNSTILENKMNYTIIDVTGKIMLQSLLIESETEISIKDLSSGIYFLNLNSGEKSDVFKIIKE